MQKKPLTRISLIPILVLICVLLPVMAAEAATGSSRLAVTNPAGWTPNPSNPAVVMKGTGTYTTKPEIPPAEANTPDAFVAFSQKQFAKSFSNCKFGPTIRLTVSGAEARRFEFSGEVSGMKMNYIILYVFKDGRAYSLVCGALADSFSALKPDYEKVIASARLE